MKCPKISIVTPSLNQGHFLEQTIRSVLDQKYPDLEYVIIDGGSTDNSVEIIQRHEPRLHYWVSERDRGHAHAINKGFSHTSGEIMAWLNSDDLYTPWSFSAVAEIFAQFPHISWITGFPSLWNSKGAMVGTWKSPKNIYDLLLGRYTWIQQESTFWRRSLWERAGGYVDEDYVLMVDGELWTRFFLKEDLYSVNCVLGGYREHADNRAKHHYGTCLQEMDKAISIMRSGCTRDILDKSSRLALVSKLTQIPIINRRPIMYLLRKMLCSNALTSAAYKDIVWKNDTWIEQRIPFAI